GEKRAREMWFLCRQYDAATAERWGLVNAVVPAARLLDEAKSWVAEMAAMSPTALRFLKHSFNTDTEHQAGLANVATAGLDLFVATPEGREGAAAFAEERAPDPPPHLAKPAPVPPQRRPERLAMDFTSRTAVVTGAASGIGQAVALGLAGRGAAVIAADRDLDGAKRTA